MPHLGVDPAQLHAAWDEIRLSGHLTEGKYVRLFEDAVSEWCGMPACAVNSAGTGLYTMLRLAGPPEGKPVAVGVNTFYATGAMARENGNSIILIDSNPADLSMSVAQLEVLKVVPSAVILTHVGGSLARDYTFISAYCDKHHIPLFEDASHALGTKTDFTAGRLGHSAVFSLYPTKAVPCGEGGVIVSRDPQFIAFCREFRNYGKYKENGLIRYRRSGFNFRMDEWTAAVAYLQMQRLPQILQARHEAASNLTQVIKRSPMASSGLLTTNHYKFAVMKDEAVALGITKFAGNVYQRSDQLAEALGITDQGPFPVADFIADQLCCLPLDETSYHGQTPDQILASLRA